jgi:hypothetical protein
MLENCLVNTDKQVVTTRILAVQVLERKNNRKAITKSTNERTRAVQLGSCGPSGNVFNC